MFKDTKAFATYATNDIEAAKKFYAEMLGLSVTEIEGMLQLNIAGGGKVIIYPKPDHEPAVFTVLNFPVDNIEEAMDRLSQKGVSFEIYTEGDAKTDDKGVSSYGDTKAAWFKDPAGNILALLEGM